MIRFTGNCRLAKHEDFEDQFSCEFDLDGSNINYKRVPGGWTVDFGKTNGGICFIPFPDKYIQIEEE